MKVYLDLVRKVLTEGRRKENRTGIDTLSLFNVNYEVDLRAGFPLLTTKAMSWKNIVVENLWFLSGAPDIGLLHRHGCRFWDPWADEEGRVPSPYGRFWRGFPVPDGQGGVTPNDQLRWVLDELRRNPTSRRLVVSAWEPGNAQASALPPCHCFYVFNVQRDDRGIPRLNLHLTQRSADVALGVPYNIAGYALLLHLMARWAGLEVGRFAHSLVDAHVYTSKADGSLAEFDHVPGLEKQLERRPRPLPRLVLDPSLDSIDVVDRLLPLETEDLMALFRLEGYDPAPALRFRVAP